MFEYYINVGEKIITLDADYSCHGNGEGDVLYFYVKGKESDELVGTFVNYNYFFKVTKDIE